MFLKMPTPFERGTKVALSLEAGGRVLPFAQAEVVWRNLEDSKPAAKGNGFGVRFTGFLHPRANELVDYLVANLESGKPLVAPGAMMLWPKRIAWGISGAVAVILGAVISTAVLHLVQPQSQSQSQSQDEVAVVAAPPVEEVVALPPVALDEAKPVTTTVESVASEPAVANAPEVPVAEPVKLQRGDVAAAAAEPVKQQRVAVAAPEPIKRPAPGRAPKKAVEVKARKAAPSSEPVKAAKAEPAPRVGSEPLMLTIPSGAVRWLNSRLDGSRLDVVLSLTAGASITRAFTLHDPDRVAIDVKGAMPERSHVIDGSREVVRVRVGKIVGGTRIVIDLSRAPGAPVVAVSAVSIPLQ